MTDEQGTTGYWWKSGTWTNLLQVVAVGLIIRPISRSRVSGLGALFHAGQVATVKDCSKDCCRSIVQERSDSGVAATDLRKLMELSCTWVDNVAGSGVVRLQVLIEEAFRLSWPSLDMDAVTDYLSVLRQRMEHLELKQFVKSLVITDVWNMC